FFIPPASAGEPATTVSTVGARSANEGTKRGAPVASHAVKIRYASNRLNTGPAATIANRLYSGACEKDRCLSASLISSPLSSPNILTYPPTGMAHRRYWVSPICRPAIFGPTPIEYLTTLTPARRAPYLCHTSWNGPS